MFPHTPLYLVFVLVVAGLYWLLPRHTGRKALLLAASYAFYTAFDVRFALLLLADALVLHAIARALPTSRHPRRLAWLSAGFNLGLLGLFKYANFFLGSLAGGLHMLGVPLQPASLQLLLPLGISFYTFQAIAYTTEIYRGKLAPASLVDLALYLAFFPKLIAGPLASPTAFLEQLATPRPRPSGGELGGALRLLLLGLIKKVLIADSLAALADTAFRAAAGPNALQFASPLYLQGFYLYAIQIYADFSGYTDLARASARLLGFTLPDNFRQPYLATSLGDFWNRWHMSLTLWFREYLFFPLSRGLLTRLGRRRAALAQALANVVTLLLIGLWHGAAGTYLVWGLYHALVLTLERLTGYRPAGRWRSALSGVVTFHVVAVGWLLFRADSLATAGRFLAGLLAFQQMGWLGHYVPSILLALGLSFSLDLAAAGRVGWTGRAVERWQPALVVAALVLLTSLGLLALARGGLSQPFIYGQF